MTSPLRLHYAPDNASLCVRLALDAVGAPFQTVLVDRAARGQKSQRYLALNPNGLIPVLETPDGALFERVPYCYGLRIIMRGCSRCADRTARRR